MNFSVPIFLTYSRTFFQGFIFFLTVRYLDANVYGILSLLLSIIFILGPWVFFGQDVILLRNASTNQTLLKSHFVTAFVISSLGFIFLLNFFILIVNPFFFGHALPLDAMMMVVLAELLINKWIELLALTCQTLNKAKKAAVLRALLPMIRALMLFYCFVIGNSASLNTWALIYFAAALVALIIAIAMMWKMRWWSTKSNTVLPKSFQQRFSEGLKLCCSSTMEKLERDIENLVLIKFIDFQTFGIYSASRRFIEFIYVPMFAIITYMSPAFYRWLNQQADEIKQVRKAFKLLLYFAMFSVPLVIGAAWFLPAITNYDTVIVDMAIAMALLPVVLMQKQLMMNFLIGIHQTGLALRIFAGSIALSIALNIVFISQYSWYGAIASVYCSSLIVLLIYCYRLRHELRSAFILYSECRD